MILQLEMDNGLTLMEDSGLLEGLRRHREEALEVLIELYGSALTRAAYAYLSDRSAADDIVQETFIAAWDGAHRTSDATKVRSWLFGILFNRMRKHLRTQTRRKRREEKAAELRVEMRVDGNGQHALSDEDLHTALQQLDEKARSVIVLRFQERLSVEETARALDIPEGTVKSRTSAALRKLREGLGGFYGNE